MTLWASRWLGPPLRISVSVHSAFGMTRAKSSNTSDYALLSCLSGVRLDLSAEDDAVALILAECPARPYAELIKSDIPGPSNVRSARSSASRPLPPPTMGVSPIGLSAATPTRSLPDDPKEAAKIRARLARFTNHKGSLYKRGFFTPILKCIAGKDTEYVLREVHEGICGNHIGARALAGKVLRQGYYWPTILKDATDPVKKCRIC